MHPMYRHEAQARQVPEGAARASGEPRYRIASGKQIGAFPAPDRGGEARSYTVKELQIPESSLDRLVRLGALIPE
jgi:hypothetical protein